MELSLFGIIACLFIAFLFRFFGICTEWERRPLFTLGRFSRIVGPGLYFYVPLLQSVKGMVDIRILTYTVPLQKGLTRDNIPVSVDAIIFYKVQTVKAAVLNVDNYHIATQMAARAAIRDMVGKSNLDELLSERDQVGDMICRHISEFVIQWGVTIVSVEIKDVIVAKELEDAISREAAAEREKRARLKLAEAEELTADLMNKAAAKYATSTTSLQLRSMNMLYEMCMEGKSTMIFVPTNNTHGMPSLIGVESIKDLVGSTAPPIILPSESHPHQSPKMPPVPPTPTMDPDPGLGTIDRRPVH
jgi:regulator of protease activity HflC (stomatin/prohibitin superfamily)